ncbi:hypothetical protein T492DRAFT_887940, partial [Pavlovales sp. CCMP2436]
HSELAARSLGKANELERARDQLERASAEFRELSISGDGDTRDVVGALVARKEPLVHEANVRTQQLHDRLAELVERVLHPARLTVMATTHLIAMSPHARLSSPFAVAAKLALTKGRGQGGGREVERGGGGGGAGGASLPDKRGARERDEEEAAEEAEEGEEADDAGGPLREARKGQEGREGGGAERVPRRASTTPSMRGGAQPARKLPALAPAPEYLAATVGVGEQGDRFESFCEQVLRQLATLDNATNQLLLNAPSKLATELANPSGWADVARRNEARLERQAERERLEAEAENNPEARAARKLGHLLGGSDLDRRRSSTAFDDGAAAAATAAATAAAAAEAEGGGKPGRARGRGRGADGTLPKATTPAKASGAERSKPGAVAAKPRATEGRSAAQIDTIRDSIVLALKQPNSNSRPFNDRSAAVAWRTEEPAQHRHESTSAAVDDSEPVLTRHALLQRGRAAVERAEREHALQRLTVGREVWREP